MIMAASTLRCVVSMLYIDHGVDHGHFVKKKRSWSLYIVSPRMCPSTKRESSQGKYADHLDHHHMYFFFRLTRFLIIGSFNLFTSLLTDWLITRKSSSKIYQIYDYNFSLHFF
jgi:hypothetical protein